MRDQIAALGRRLGPVIDTVIAFVEDAIALLPQWFRTRFASAPAEEGEGEADPIWTSLVPGKVLIIDLPFLASDRFEAERALRLQASRWVPLPLEQVELDFQELPEGRWQVAIVRKSHLREMGGGVFRGGERGQFRFFGQAGREARRRRWGFGLAAGVALVVSAQLMLGEAIARAERVRDVRAQERQELAQDIRARQTRLDAAMNRAQALGQTTDQLAGGLASLATALPEGWSILSLRLEGGEWVIVCDARPDVSALSEEIEQTLLSDPEVSAVTMRRIGTVGGLDRFEISLTPGSAS